MKKIEDVLFYSASRIQPPKNGLESILDNLPVTNPYKTRYNYVMGPKFALPIGIAILALLVFFAAKNSQPQTVLELPATLTKQNVDGTINQVDAGINAGMDEMDKDLNEMDQDSVNEKLDDESSINQDDNTNQESDQGNINKGS